MYYYDWACSKSFQLDSFMSMYHFSAVIIYLAFLSCEAFFYSVMSYHFQCYGTRLCPSTPAQACFTVWSNSSSSFADTPGDHLHNSGLDVKMMGCFQASSECTKNDNCTADSDSDRRSARGHLFCCCSGE